MAENHNFQKHVVEISSTEFKKPLKWFEPQYLVMDS
jgi:hypothetical protein